MARHRGMMPPINSVKHFIPQTNTDIASATVLNVLVADAVPAPPSAAVVEVVEGAVIKAIRSEMWIWARNSTSIASQTVIIVEKVPAGQVPATFAQMLALQSYPNKKNVFFTFQGIAPAQGGNPIAPIRDWVKIPKGKQRFGLGDRYFMNIAAVNELVAVCGMHIYKEYR